MQSCTENTPIFLQLLTSRLIKVKLSTSCRLTRRSGHKCTINWEIWCNYHISWLYVSVSFTITCLGCSLRDLLFLSCLFHSMCRLPSLVWSRLAWSRLVWSSLSQPNLIQSNPNQCRRQIQNQIQGQGSKQTSSLSQPIPLTPSQVKPSQIKTSLV